MKKAKGNGIDAVTDSFAFPQDPRIRFRHQGLLQDYRDLLKVCAIRRSQDSNVLQETDSMRKKIEILKQRKLTLLTEVQFLRRRHRYFVDNKISKPLRSRKTIKPNKATKRKDHGTKAPVSSSIATKKHKTATNLRSQAVPPANPKERQITKKDNVAMYISSTSVNVDKIDMLGGRKEMATMNSRPAYGLPQKQMLNREADAALRNLAPIFDLNKISAEELQTCSDHKGIEVAYKFLRGGRAIDDDHRKEIDLGVHSSRTNMKGLNKVGKRRISWQDQVALRV